MEKKSKNWAPGIIPQTEACYQSALDFTTLSNYQLDFRFAAIPFQLEKMMGKLGEVISFSLLPYWKAEPTSSGQASQSKEVSHVQVNVTFLPEIVEDDSQRINLHWATNNVIEHYNEVSLPFDNFLLPSTSISRATRIAYESDVIRKIDWNIDSGTDFPDEKFISFLTASCLVTSQYIRTLDKVKFSNNFSPCYTLVTSDCGSNPLFGVFVRRTTGLYPLVKSNNFNIEII